MVIELTDIKDFSKLIKEGNVLVDFYSTWCEPCKKLTPILNKLNKTHVNLNIVKVNINSFNELAATFNISYVPTLIYLVDGKIKKSTSGFLPFKSLERLIK